MSEWTKVTLGELIDIKHGYAFKGEFFSDVPNGSALLTPGNFHIGGGFKGDKFKYYTGDIPGDYLLSPGDVIVTMTDLSKDGDTLGYSARIPESTNRFLHNQRLGLVITKSKRSDITFIYWLLRTSHYQKTIVNSCSGSTVKHTSPSKIQEYDFLLPPITEQKAINGVLSCLDRKIENLRKQNETLEAIAQTLFKHWFVDFEFPNEDGKPYKSSGGAMVQSELGKIPVGWRVGKFRDITAVINGRAYKQTEFREEGTPIVRIQNLTGKGQTVYSDLALDKDKYISKGDLIYAWSATFGPYIWRGVKSIYHYHIWKLNCFNPAFKYYLYIHLKKVSDRVQGQGTGSIFTHITKELMESQELSIPEVKVMERWHSIAKPIFDKIMVNYEQIQTLTQIRDVLLPKLMSGKLRITK